MILRQLSRIDLNLLVALQALLEEENVSRAAERLFISQPAMSKTLARLRETLGDPLFVRGPHGIKPTPRAQELRARLNLVLEDVLALVNPASFDLARYEGEFIIAISEHMSLGIIPELMQRLRREAPGIRIKLVTRMEHQLEQLADGKLDFALHMARSHYGEEFDCDSLGGCTPILLMRPDHPLALRRFTLEDMAEYPIVGLYVADREELAIFRDLPQLAKDMSANPPRLELSHMLTAMEVVRRGDFLLAALPFLTTDLHLTKGLAAVRMPTSTAPLEYLLVSHRLISNSPAHQWLRKQLLEISLRYQYQLAAKYPDIFTVENAAALPEPGD